MARVAIQVARPHQTDIQTGWQRLHGLGPLRRQSRVGKQIGLFWYVLNCRAEDSGKSGRPELKVQPSVMNGTLDGDHAVAKRWARQPFRRTG
jgi:hypothetical protein